MSPDRRDRQQRALSFGGVADAYDRGRPDYPADAARWLVTGEVPDDDSAGHGRPGGLTASGTDVLRSGVRVLELGAGTGKLTAVLRAHGHDVHATDPDEAMLEVLRRDLPRVAATTASAEDIPLPDASVDVVVAAQCFHWFDTDAALDEISRVLRPGGTLALVWHVRDERIPWVKKLGRIIGTQEHLVDPAAALADSPLFDDVEERTFSHWQVVNRRSIVDLVTSRSSTALMAEAERAATIEALLALYDDYGRGMDGMQLPYRTRCFRSRALPRPVPVPAPVEPEALDLSAPSLSPSPELTSGLTGGAAPALRRSDPALDLPALALDPLTQPVTHPVTQPPLPVATVPLSVAAAGPGAGLRDEAYAGGPRRGRSGALWPGYDGRPDPLTDSADQLPRVAYRDPLDPGEDTGMLLIDFR